MTSSNQNFQNLRKESSQFFVKTMWSKFQLNRSKTEEVRDDHRHTHTIQNPKWQHTCLNCPNGRDTTHISSYLIGYKAGIPVNVTDIYRAFLGDAFRRKLRYNSSDRAENSKILKWASATFHLGHDHLKKISKIQ